MVSTIDILKGGIDGGIGRGKHKAKENGKVFRPCRFFSWLYQPCFSNQSIR
jgi:hypothetical protein